jgi:hypothetical protein
MHLLNTGALTHARLGHRRAASRIEQVGEQNVATTTNTAIEFIRRRHEYILKAADGAQPLRAQELRNASEAMLMDFEIFRFDAGVAAEVAALGVKSRKTERDPQTVIDLSHCRGRERSQDA